MPEMTFRDAIRETLREAMLADERVFIMGEDIGVYGGAYAVTRGLLQEFGERRVRDTPIAESVVVGAGVGAAMGGLRPVVELMSINFSLLAMDQVVNNAAKLRYMSGGQIAVPLIIRTVSGGGNMLAASHSQSLEGWYATVPGMRVVVPATPYDARGLLRTAFRDPNPVLFVEHSLLYTVKGEVPGDPYEVPFGKAEIRRTGSDVTIVAAMRMVHVALKAAEELAPQGIEAEVIDLRSLNPMDHDSIVQSVTKTTRGVVVEEGWMHGGFGAEVASLMMTEAFDYLDGPVVRVAGKDVPMPYSRSLEQAAIPSAQDIVKAVRSLF